MIVTPCFNLKGNCKEAIALYEKAFEAETKLIINYSEAKDEDWKIPLSNEQRNMVYYAELFIGSQRIMFSDILEFDLHNGNSLFLTVTFDSKEEVQKAYNVLLEGSTIIYPMQATTYSTCFVSLVDKFGFRWALMTE
jgi:PhnB protein